MSRYVGDREVIRDSQYGFTKGKLYVTYPVAFYRGVTGSMEKESATHVFNLDIRKAFDMCLHNIVACILSRCRFNKWTI